MYNSKERRSGAGGAVSDDGVLGEAVGGVDQQESPQPGAGVDSSERRASGAQQLPYGSANTQVRIRMHACLVIDRFLSG